MGKMVDTFGSKKTIALNVVSLIVTICMQYVSLLHDSFDVYSFLSCFFWGLSDGFVNTHCLQVLGYEFSLNTEPFAILYFV